MEFLSTVFNLSPEIPLWFQQIAAGLILLISGASAFLAYRCLKAEDRKREKDERL